MITSGNCESHGYDYIWDYSECEIAAKSLGYEIHENYQSEVTWGADQWPFGCFDWSSNRFVFHGLYADKNPDEFTDCTIYKECLCKEK